jgi:hypothetical protein
MAVNAENPIREPRRLDLPTLIERRRFPRRQPWKKARINRT